jgi:hypothetical protein
LRLRLVHWDHSDGAPVPVPITETDEEDDDYGKNSVKDYGTDDKDEQYIHSRPAAGAMM